MTADPPLLSDLSPQTVNALVAVAIAVGAWYCALGYRTLKAIIALTGFGLAGATAASLASVVSGGHLYVTVGAAFAGGICGALALFFLYRAGVFCLGMLGGYLVTMNALTGRGEPWALWALLGGAFGGGLIALALEKAMMTLATAAIGAWVVVWGVAYFLLGAEALDRLETGAGFEGDYGVMLACWAVLFLAGTLAQFATHRPRPVRTE